MRRCRPMSSICNLWLSTGLFYRSELCIPRMVWYAILISYVLGNKCLFSKQIFHDLQKDLAECLDILPNSVQKLVKRTNIWINDSYVYGPRESPKTLKHCVTHHSEEWLIR